MYWKGLVRRQGLDLRPGVQPAKTLGKSLNICGSHRVLLLRGAVGENLYDVYCKALASFMKSSENQCEVWIYLNLTFIHLCFGSIF